MDALLSFVDRTPTVAFVLLAAVLGFAPFYPEPHVWEKLKMLAAGTLRKPIDIFDLFWHVWPFGLLLLKLLRNTSVPPAA